MPPLALDSLLTLKEYSGRELATTDWVVMSQERIDAYAEATGDRQWIHVDVERARRESPYGRTIAHGFLTLSLISHFVREAVQLPKDVKRTINYGLNRVRFPAPVLSGQRIRARIRLQSFKELDSSSVETIFDITVETEGAEKPCCAAEWIVRYYS